MCEGKTSEELLWNFCSNDAFCDFELQTLHTIQLDRGT